MSRVTPVDNPLGRRIPQGMTRAIRAQGKRYREHPFERATRSEHNAPSSGRGIVGSKLGL